MGPGVGRGQGPFSLSTEPPSRGMREPNRGSSNAVLSRVGLLTQDGPPGSLPVAGDLGLYPGGCWVHGGCRARGEEVGKGEPAPHPGCRRTLSHGRNPIEPRGQMAVCGRLPTGQLEDPEGGTPQLSRTPNCCPSVRFLGFASACPGPPEPPRQADHSPGSWTLLPRVPMMGSQLRVQPQRTGSPARESVLFTSVLGAQTVPGTWSFEE